ncbi:MAG: hypothetical protein CNLJKLNK_00265 [Holosporales bacterium]
MNFIYLFLFYVFGFCIFVQANQEHKILLVDANHNPMLPQGMNEDHLKNNFSLMEDFGVCDVKQYGYEYARRLFLSKLRIKNLGDPILLNLTSKLCTQKDIESDWYKIWCARLELFPLYHRKPWEFAFIMQVLFDQNCLISGGSALGFGCGEEPIPALLCSYGINVIATDCPPDLLQSGWAESGQYTGSIEKLIKPAILSKEIMEKHCVIEYADMNNIPEKYKQKNMNIVWSACALEHLGSIENGINFIINTLSCLKVGGVSVHTTEYSLTDDYVDNWPTVTFTKNHLDRLKSLIDKDLFCCFDFDLSQGDGILDKFIDIPPYSTGVESVHLRLSLDGIPCTSIGIIILRIK